MLPAKQIIVALVVASVLGGYFSLQAQALPPTMLRTVCGVAADAEEVLGNKAMAAGKIVGGLIIKPIAIAGGLKAAAVGAGMKASGATIKFVGAKMVKDGLILEGSGAAVKGAGLGVAALAVKPVAEKIIVAGKLAQGSVDAASNAADQFAKSVGDTSIQIDARIDSPIIGHHHKNVNVTAGLETAANQIKGDHGQQQQQIEQQQIQQIEQTQQQIEQQTRAKRAAAKIDPEVIKSALSLVHEAKMEDCLLRAICDLNCNPQGFGQDGKQVFMNMVRLQGSNVIDDSDLKKFKESAANGRNNSGKCEQCSNLYKKCSTKSTDLIRMASHLRMD